MTTSTPATTPLTARQAVRALGVEPRAIRFLSHRINTHWRVSSGDQRLVLRRYGRQDAAAEASALWEAQAVAAIADSGVPVPRTVAGPVRLGNAIWALFPFLPGRHLGRGAVDQAGYVRLGEALAGFHSGTEGMACPDQRPGFGEAVFGAWPRGGAGDEGRREALLGLAERADAGLGALLRRELAGLEARDLPGVFAGVARRVVHCDFTPWNLRFRQGRLSALLDFEYAHVDVEAMDLASARRGYHDAVVAGYLRQRPLPAAQVAALDALWTANLFSGVWEILEAAERAGALPADAFAWHLYQFEKTRPFAG